MNRPTSPASPTGRAAPPLPAVDLVPGVACPQGHVNHEANRHCWICGSLMTDDRAHIVLTRRPVVGMLISDEDGKRHPVSAEFFIVAREPALPPRCVSVRDRGRSAVRVRVTFAGWTPLLIAEGPGAWITPPTGRPESLFEGRPTLLMPDCVVHLGAGSFRFHALDTGQEPPAAPRRAQGKTARHARPPGYRR